MKKQYLIFYYMVTFMFGCTSVHSYDEFEASGEFEPYLESIIIDSEGKVWFGVGNGLPSNLSSYKASDLNYLGDGDGIIIDSIRSVQTIDQGKNVTLIGRSLYRSEDYGKTWQKNSDIEFKSSTNLHVWDGVFGVVASSQNNVISITSDHGKTWTQIDVPNEYYPGMKEITLLANSIWVKTGSNYYMYTRNLGKTWQMLDPEKMNIKYLSDITFLTEDTIFAINREQILKSENGGKDWSILTETKMQLKDVTLVNENEFYISTIDEELFYTKNSGKNWRKIILPYQGKRINPDNVSYPRSRVKIQNRFIVVINDNDCVAIRPLKSKEKWQKFCPIEKY